MRTFSELATELDREGMLDFLRKFPDDCAAAFNRIDSKHHPWAQELSEKEWRSWLFLGMGGSAAGGSFIADLADQQGSANVKVNRNYSLPSWWTPETIIVATSYSGNTEETLSATEDAISKGGTVIAICAGGQLAGLAEIHYNVHLVLVPSGQPPRSAFGHIFGSQLSLAWEFGLLERPLEANLIGIITRMRAHVEQADCTTSGGDIAALAAELVERPIAIIAPTELTGVAERARNQLNENSARYARVAIIPEMNHNEVVAWGDSTTADEKSTEQALLLFTWEKMHPRVKQRFDWFIEHLRTPAAWRIECEGDSLLEAMLNACIDMDWLSCALALLHGKDPSSIGPIIGLKGFLNSIK